MPPIEQPILLATRSVGKLRELRPLFAAHGFSVVDLADVGIAETPDEDALEVHPTFEENALAKARYFYQRSRMPTVADDSGLAVRALGGRPGVLSKRWGGRTDLSGQLLDDENNRLLLSSLRGVADRAASYVCAAAFVDDSREVVCRGTVDGAISDVARGSNGFGYDPYFVADELGRSFGEASGMEKERISHRGRAMRALIDQLEVASASRK
jgi:XTP/dITP diphosphohydrolase